MKHSHIRRLQAIAQTGLTYANDPFDVERYTEIQQIVAEMAARATDVSLETTLGLFSSQQGYATPKIDVRGVIFRDNKILLVQERADMGWTLPGGWADVGESLAENVVREVYEESGFETRPVKLLAAYDRDKHDHPSMLMHTYKFFVLCELVGGKAKPSLETAAVAFFAADQIPPLSVYRTTPQQITRMFAHYDHPNWPTDFD